MDDAHFTDEPAPPFVADQQQPERITTRQLFRHLLGFFALEHGLLRTIKELALRPGTTIRSYLFTDQRAHLSNPVGLALLTAGLTVFLMVKTGSVDKIVNNGFETGVELSPAAPENETATTAAEEDDSLSAALGPEKLEGLIADYYNIVLLAAIPVLSLFSFIFFRKDRFYYAEHLVVNTYITGFQNVLYMPIAPFLGKLPELSLVYLAASMSYQIWVYMAVFSGTRWQRFWRASLTFSMGMVAYTILLAMIITAIVAILAASA
ncbi:MAG: DUF3667 domain-containing protein [Bacteroidetes bacterium]|nr:DUF3667 domain-containing protein [Bacteroidota bacterium]